MKINKIKRFEIQHFKDVYGKEPEVFISREDIEKWAKELKQDKQISGVIPYLREVKQ